MRQVIDDVLARVASFNPCGFVMSGIDSDQPPQGGDENNNDDEKMDTSAAPVVADYSIHYSTQCWRTWSGGCYGGDW